MGFFCCIKAYFGGEQNFYIFLTLMTLGIVLAATKKHFAGGVNYHSPPLAGQVIVITGANTGLGFEAAKHFAS